MILVDTSIWVDHLRDGDPGLVAMLDRGEVLGHSWVTGEVALGRLRARREVLRLLGQLPQATVATPEELMVAIEHHELPGVGIGYVDVQLLASTLLTGGARLWTRDRRLGEVAARAGVAYSE